MLHVNKCMYFIPCFVAKDITYANIISGQMLIYPKMNKLTEKNHL